MNKLPKLVYYKTNDDKTNFAFKIIAGKYHGKIVVGEITKSETPVAEKMKIQKEGLYIITDEDEVAEVKGKYDIIITT